MQNLTISVLGPPQIALDGAPVGFDTRKAIALLAYLVCTRRAHSRDALAALLWPEYADARNGLRRTLSTIQHVLGSGWLVVEREQVAVVAQPGLHLDVADFESRIATATDRVALAAAVGLYRDDFLHGFTLRDSPAFDEWQFFEAERLRQIHANALERLLVLHADTGDYEAAIETARSRLALDPFHEPAHQTLMQLYLRAGQRSAALRQYRECARVLEQELGVAPADETVRLYEMIRAAPAAPTKNPPQPRAPEPTPATETEAPVGRDDERKRLRAVYAATRTGAVAVIEGQPGIGKTRLAEDLLLSANAIGAATFVARCYEGEAGLAYAPVAGLLREAVTLLERSGRLGVPHDQLAEIARLVPALARRIAPPEAPAAPGPDARRRFFEAVADVLIDACNDASPGVMLVDDAHWADSASLDLLAFLARRLRGRPGLLLLTWRGEDVPAKHPLRALLAEARRVGAAEHMVLGGLNAAAVATLARHHRVAIAPDLVERLHRES